jgi:hypothetical protein
LLTLTNIIAGAEPHVKIIYPFRLDVMSGSQKTAEGLAIFSFPLAGL